MLYLAVAYGITLSVIVGYLVSLWARQSSARRGLETVDEPERRIRS